MCPFSPSNFPLYFHLRRQMFNFAFLKHTATGCHGSGVVGWGGQLRNQLEGRGNQLRERHHPQIIGEVDKSQEESRVDLSKLPLPKHSQWPEKFMHPLQVPTSAGED